MNNTKLVKPQVDGKYNENSRTTLNDKNNYNSIRQDDEFIYTYVNYTSNGNKAKALLWTIFSSTVLLCFIVIFIILFVPTNDSAYYDLTLLKNNSRIYLKSTLLDKTFYVRTANTNKVLLLTESIPWIYGSSFDVYSVGECFKLKSHNGKWLEFNKESKFIEATAKNFQDGTSFVAVTVPNDNNINNIKLKLCKDNYWLDLTLASKRKKESNANNTNKVLTVTTRYIAKKSYWWQTKPRPNNNLNNHNITNAIENTVASTKAFNVATFSYEIVNQIYGVNLGGWFIPEVWMCPSFFNNTGLGWGGSLCAMVNYSRPLTASRMKNNLNNWIKENDFIQISKQGYNSIRLPIGYWNVMPDPYNMYEPADYKIGLSYIDWTFLMAKKYKLTVLIDLHGLPGSQNGYDHSGCNKVPSFLTSSNIKIALDAIERISKRYGDHPNLLGIELANEPSQFYSERNHSVIVSYYEQSYKIIRKYSSTALIVFNELYSSCYGSWNDTLKEPTYYNVIVDWHLYEWPQAFLNVSDHLINAKLWYNNINNYLPYHPIMIGEWSMSTGMHQAGQQFVDICVKSFSKTIGWYIWNWKIEKNINYDEWSVSYQYDINGMKPLKKYE